VLALTFSASCAWAQSTPEAPPDPDAEASMRFGPLAVKSTIALRNIGFDTNVFNAADVENPQSDFTMTFAPATDMWLRLGRTWISGKIHVDWVYYRTFASERSANSEYQVAASRTLNRVTLTGNARHLNTRERPGFEIDARSRRGELESDGAVDVRALSRTYLGGRVWRRRVEFDRDAVFRQASLADELNRTNTGGALTARHVVTSLTTAGLEIGREHERYAFSPLRDSDSTRIIGTLSLQPLALIHGNAAIGYRHYSPVTPDLPDYHGATVAVDLSYNLSGTTRFGAQATRDVKPSFEIAQPYYVETGVGGSIQQQVYGPFDVLGRVTTGRLAYRDRMGIASATNNRADRVHAFSIGAGYRLGLDKRLGLTIERQSRASNVYRYGYSGLRVGFSLTYET